MELKRIQSNIGMGILLISWSMLFAALFLGYFVFRFSQDAWPPMGMTRVPLIWPTFSTIVIGLASFTYFKFEQSFLQKDKKSSNSFLTYTIVLALIFLLSQVWLWEVLKSEGLYTNAGIFPSLLYGFTWIHWGHIILAIPALLYLWYSLAVNNRFAVGELSVINIGRFWHFLGIIWLLIYLALFVF